MHRDDRLFLKDKSGALRRFYLDITGLGMRSCMRVRDGGRHKFLLACA